MSFDYIAFLSVALAVAAVVQVIKQGPGICQKSWFLRLVSLVLGFCAAFAVPLHPFFGAAAGAMSTTIFWAVKKKLRDDLNDRSP